MQLAQGRMALSDGEQKTLEKLIAGKGDDPVSFTREGELLLVHVGDVTYEVASDGKRKKVT